MRDEKATVQLDLLQRLEDLVRSGDTASAMNAISDLRQSVEAGDRDQLTGIRRREALVERRSGNLSGVLFVDRQLPHG